MKVYTVHEPPEPGSARLDRITFIKEGFCWPALVFPAIWLIFRRMWLVLIAWLAVGVGLGLAAELAAETELAVAVLSVLFTLWFALEANALRRWSLARRGWRMLGVAAGADREAAEQSFFRRLAAVDARPAPSATPRVPPRPAARVAPGSEPVIGLFPQPE